MLPTTYLDFFNPAFFANPHSIYAQLRAEAPIYRLELPNGSGLWLVTRYDDVVAVLKDPRFVKNVYTTFTPEEAALKSPIQEPMDMLFNHMLGSDPPDHTRLRSLVHKAFTPRLVEQLRPRIQLIADTLLAAVVAAGQMDLINDYAFPLPITVIAELLGVPTTDQDMFHRWSSRIIEFDPTEHRFTRVRPMLEEFVSYLGGLVAERRARPLDDLLSALVQVEEAGDRLSEHELFSMVLLLLVAGHETTVNLIGNGMLVLLQHPEQLSLLKAQPDLIHAAVEELLRYDGPVHTSTRRFASADIELGGHLIRRRDLVLVVIASAGRDEQRFADPALLDLARSDNRHVAFGHGIHYCLGAPLARLEGAIAINTLLRRMPELRLAVAPETLTWRSSILIRGLERLPVEFSPP